MVQSTICEDQVPFQCTTINELWYEIYDIFNIINAEQAINIGNEGNKRANKIIKRHLYNFIDILTK